jgi:hypothetical protein
MFWWIVIAIVAFLILRSVLRAFSASRYYGGAPDGLGDAPPGATGYGYGGYGGGSFWSGLLGGLGGAWLGNELFRGGGGVAPREAGQLPPGTAEDLSAAESGGSPSGGGFGAGDVGGGDSGGGGKESDGGW